uniref:Uncharacterized protein n=1 Tax=Arundo donax TaxID=35708 RepID=A0A0A9C8D5_ARUDO
MLFTLLNLQLVLLEQ